MCHCHLLMPAEWREPLGAAVEAEQSRGRGHLPTPPPRLLAPPSRHSLRSLCTTARFTQLGPGRWTDGELGHYAPPPGSPLGGIGAQPQEGNRRASKRGCSAARFAWWFPSWKLFSSGQPGAAVPICKRRRSSYVKRPPPAMYLKDWISRDWCTSEPMYCVRLTSIFA